MIMKKIKLKQLFFTFTLLFITTLLEAQPTKKDYIRTAFELGLFLSIEYDLINMSSIQNKNFDEPNTFDTYFRDKMLWSNKNIDKAKTYSDILLYGIVLGSIPTTPLLSKKDDYKSMVLANIEVLAINGLVTDITKYLVGRQRPYSYFKTYEQEKDTFKSFFSGHTSSAFAIATSSAMMLSDEYQNKKTLIWGSTYALASATGYFRIAADKHYLSDVIVGAIVGSSIGYLTQKSIAKSYLSVNIGPTKTLTRNFQLSWDF